MTIENNRIVSPLTVASAAEDARLAPIPASPTGIALLPQAVIRVATVVIGLAAVGIPIFTTLLPAPWAVTGLAICSSIVGLGTVLGIASPGVRQAGTAVAPALQVPQSPARGPQP
jgi:hypothetical protein